MTLIIVTILSDLHTLILGLFMFQISYNFGKSHTTCGVASFLYMHKL